MTFREMNLAVFRGEQLPHVLFQPRFEPWFWWQKNAGGLPEELRGRAVRDAYDMIGASMRYVAYYTGQPQPTTHGFAPEVKLREERQGDLIKRRYETPHGELSETLEFTVDRTWRTVEFAAKTSDDLRALRWLLERQRFALDEAKLRQGMDNIGDRGVGQFWVPKSPYFAMAQQWMRYEDFVYALLDSPDKIEDCFAAIDASYDGLYEQLLASRQIRIINYGENVAVAYLTREWWEGYAIPWYEKRSGQLRKAGIFTHIHIDGDFRPLLDTVRHLPFDGIEALTPLPQGDFSIEEMMEACGDKVLLDGIPAVLFLAHHPMEQLVEAVEKIVRLKHPRLVLGVSDELPQGCDDEGWRRLKWVAEYCRKYRA